MLSHNRVARNLDSQELDMPGLTTHSGLSMPHVEHLQQLAVCVQELYVVHVDLVAAAAAFSVMQI